MDSSRVQRYAAGKLLAGILSAPFLIGNFATHALAGRFKLGQYDRPNKKAQHPLQAWTLFYGPFRAHDDDLLLIVPAIYPAIMQLSSTRRSLVAEAVRRPYPD